jgi:hypothetical protein
LKPSFATGQNRRIKILNSSADQAPITQFM